MTQPTDFDDLRAAGAAAAERLATAPGRDEADDDWIATEPLPYLPNPGRHGAAPTQRPGPPGADPSPEQRIRHLRAANAIARTALASGHHPFGAVLVGPDHETVLLEQGNVDSVNHAEAVLARMASRAWSPEELWGCTLYTTVEPCCMCAGTQYWAHIGRLVYGMDERRLAGYTGAHPENPTLDLPCREVFASGHKAIRVWGPEPEVEAEIAVLHEAFWQQRDAG